MANGNAGWLEAIPSALKLVDSVWLVKLDCKVSELIESQTTRPIVQNLSATLLVPDL